VADKTGIGEHEFGVGVFEDHTAHPVAGLKPRGIRAGRHDGADHLGAGPDRTARLQHPDEPDADPTASVHTSNRAEARLEFLGSIGSLPGH
jgi:hypothetical protein